MGAATSRGSSSGVSFWVGFTFLLFGGACMFGRGCRQGPSVATIELEPKCDMPIVVGTYVAAPTARALNEKGEVMAGTTVVCTSDTPSVSIVGGRLSATEATQATVTCAAGGAAASFAVIALAPHASVTTGYELRPILAGTFTMGSPLSEANRFTNESQHEVTLPRAYLMGTTEVTQAQWEKVMGSHPSWKDQASGRKGPMSLLAQSYPVQYVNWCDAVVFANALSAKDGLTAVYDLPDGMSAGMGAEACNRAAPSVTVRVGADGYRLPTEAEWERAARGGTTDTWSGANRQADLCGVANVADTSAKLRIPTLATVDCDDHQPGLTAAGTYAANTYGLKDMSGNLWEWTWDIYEERYSEGPVTDPMGASVGSNRVLRGGSWMSGHLARVAGRGSLVPGPRFGLVGLRLTKTIYVAGREVGECKSGAPAVQPRDGALSETKSANTTITDTAGGEEARLNENPLRSDTAAAPELTDTPENVEISVEEGAGAHSEHEVGSHEDHAQESLPSWQAQPLRPHLPRDALATYTSAITGYALAAIPPGTYTIGSPATETNHFKDETQHTVTLTRGVLMGVTEVTQGQYKALMGTNPVLSRTDCGRLENRAGPADDEPVYCVSWVDAVRLANVASVKEGLEPCYVILGSDVSWPKGLACAGYRLPTESEWEIAARGGESGIYAGGDDLGSLAWFRGNSGARTHRVGQKAANGYGLYDMSGNVLEWTWDLYDEAYPKSSERDPIGAVVGFYRVLRGGSWFNSAPVARVAQRIAGHPYRLDGGIGVRLARTVP
jgi:formylglycine-generating enzyme required for sulfatase activity